MLTPAQKQVVGLIVEGVKQKRAAQQQAAQAAQSGQQDKAHQMQMERVKGAGKALTEANKPKPAAGSKTQSGAKPGATAKAAQAAITPYLTGDDLMGVSNATAQAENADSDARFGYAKAAGDALKASGDIERGRVAGVSAANDDAAARGLYDSGIRAGNVGMANSAAVRGQSQVQGGLAQAAVQSISQRQAARRQLGDYLGAATVKAAENGAALPVDPYNAASAPGANVKGTATVKRAAPKKRAAGLRPGTGRALI